MDVDCSRKASMMNRTYNCMTAMRWCVIIEVHLEHYTKCLFRCLFYRIKGLMVLGHFHCKKILTYPH